MGIELLVHVAASATDGHDDEYRAQALLYLEWEGNPVAYLNGRDQLENELDLDLPNVDNATRALGLSAGSGRYFSSTSRSSSTSLPNANTEGDAHVSSGCPPLLGTNYSPEPTCTKPPQGHTQQQLSEQSAASSVCAPSAENEPLLQDTLAAVVAVMSQLTFSTRSSSMSAALRSTARPACFHQHLSGTVPHAQGPDLRENAVGSVSYVDRDRTYVYSDGLNSELPASYGFNASGADNELRRMRYCRFPDQLTSRSRARSEHHGSAKFEHCTDFTRKCRSRVLRISQRGIKMESITNTVADNQTPELLVVNSPARQVRSCERRDQVALDGNTQLPQIALVPPLSGGSCQPVAPPLQRPEQLANALQPAPPYISGKNGKIVHSKSYDIKSCHMVDSGEDSRDSSSRRSRLLLGRDRGLVDLPLEIFSPPPGTSTRTITGDNPQITPILHCLIKNSQIVSRYRPATQNRSLRAMERGHWLIESIKWPLSQQRRFWIFLNRLVCNGRSGMGTWCRRECGTNGLGRVKIFSWAGIAPHIYLLMYAGSDGQIKRADAKWIDSMGQVVIRMS